MSAARCVAPSAAPSTFAGFRFPPEVITLAVRWYLRFGNPSAGHRQGTSGEGHHRQADARSQKTDHAARNIITGHAFIQNIRRGHYELGVDEPVTLPVMTAVDELALAI